MLSINSFIDSFLEPLQGLVAGPLHVRGAALQALDHSPAINDGTGELVLLPCVLPVRLPARHQ